MFLLLIEVLTIKIKENPKIEGVEVKGLKFLMSMFADDLDLFLKFKESAWQETMRVFSNFENLTGMKISYEKTSIYRIGSLQNSNARFFSNRKVNWINTPLNILGIYVSHDWDECLKLNYEPLITKTRDILNVWKLRNLTLLGKIQIVNSLIASLFVYRMNVLPQIPMAKPLGMLYKYF